MRFITAATHSDGYFPFLLESCKRYNVDLVVLGWGKKWTGFLCKFMWLQEYLQNVPDDEVICFMDAYDVILAKPVSKLESLFRAIHDSINARIIVSCDLHNTLLAKWVVPYVFGLCYNKPVNSGVYVGFAKDIRAMLAAILKEHEETKETDDQILMTQYCSKKKEILVDCDRIISISAVNPFSDVLNIDGATFQDGMYVYKGASPFIIHGPGNTSLIPLLEKQGYTITPEERSRLDNHHNKVFLKGLSYIQWWWVVAAVILIIGIVLAVTWARKSVGNSRPPFRRGMLRVGGMR